MFTPCANPHKHATLPCMEITPEQFALIQHCMPKQRCNVSMSNLQVVNAMAVWG